MRALRVDPIDGRTWELSDHLEWKGTIGHGDSMMGLNVAHMMASLLKTEVHMDVHWYHDKDYLFHSKDPETIVERFDFIKSKYYNEHMVKVNHIFNSNEKDIQNIRFRGFIEDKKPRGQVINGLNSWVFSDPTETSNNVVIWKPFNNATAPQKWKLSFNQKNWELIEKHYLTKKHRYNVVELDYRTPVSEAYEEIKKCKFVVCYDGMWHYITRNFCKPAIVVGNQGVIAAHNPQAILFKKPTDHGGFEKLFKNKETLEKELVNKANKYRKKMMRHINEN